MSGKLGRFVVLGMLLLTATGCDKSQPAKKPHKQATIRLATTTSTENSGLLDVLLPTFAQASGIKVHVLSMGTGKALRTAENGDCDVILVHAPTAEAEFVAVGFGVDRRPVMYNHFLILGPKDDPARVKGLTDAGQAMKRIASKQSVFCSRGDESGTHKKEKAHWKAAGIIPAGTWYQETGQGMGSTLTIANQKLAYVLADMGTYLAFRGKLSLIVLVEGGQELRNPYSVIAVNPERHKHVDAQAVKKFIDWLTGPQAQRMIGQFRVDGEQLFHPHSPPS